MKVLILGASGAMGRALTSLYRESNQHTLITYGNRVSTDQDGSVDISNFFEINTIINKLMPDIIVNLAGVYTNNYEITHKVNVEGSKNILESCRLCLNIKKIRVVLIGSSGEYGFVNPKECPVKENRVIRPITENGLSKAWQTMLASYYHGLGVDVVLARIFNLYGPGMSTRLFSGKVLQQIQEVLSGSRDKIEVGNLDSIRDYISTDSAAKLVNKISHSGNSGEIYHVASGIGVLMRDFLEAYLNSYGLNLSCVSEIRNSEYRGGHDVPVMYACMEKTRGLG